MKVLDEKIGYVDAVNPDLSKFKSSGGKLLLYHGWGDTGITPENTILYYESVLNKMGKNQSDWMRLFMAPGMAHCGGGPGVNTFDSIRHSEKWVEKGQAPETMLGTGANGLTRPLCQYPQAAEYKGTGDLEGRQQLVLQGAEEVSASRRLFAVAANTTAAISTHAQTLIAAVFMNAAYVVSAHHIEQAESHRQCRDDGG